MKLCCFDWLVLMMMILGMGMYICVYIYIVQHGADVNAADVTAQTALHWTGVRGSIQVAELLLQQGACLECADTHGYRVHVLKLC